MPPQDPLHNSDDNKAERSSLSFRLEQDCDDDEEQGDQNGESTSVRRPPGERERLESRRALRSSQTRVIANRRKSFLVQFSEMRGPPQIALLMALLAIGLGSTIGVVPTVMGDRFARLYHGYEGEAHCSSFLDPHLKPEACFLGGSDAQAAASVANLINNSLTFVTASLMGSISDEYGRKAPLIIGLTISLVPALCLYLLQVIPNMSPWWYYSSSASTGLVSWIAVALSALNDVLPPEFRAPGVGLLFAGFLFGISLSPTLALLLDRKTLSLVSFGVVLAGFLMTIFVVPETLPTWIGENARRKRKEKDKKEKERDNQTMDELEENRFYGFWSFYYGSSACRTLRRLLWRPFEEMLILNRNSFFRIIAGLAFFTGMVASGDQVLLIYYLEDQLSFDAKDVSIMFLIIGVTGIFVQVAVMKPLNDLVGEKMVIAISFFAGFVVNLLYGLAHTKSTIFAALIIAGFSQMSFPTISAIKANNVESSEQGRIQGALYSLKALASGVGPSILQFVYSKTKHYQGVLLGPGTMFLFASTLYIIGVGLTLRLPNDKTNTNPRHGGQLHASHQNQGGEMMTIDDEALGEYRRLAEDSSEDEEDYGSI